MPLGWALVRRGWRLLDRTGGPAELLVNPAGGIAEAGGPRAGVPGTEGQRERERERKREREREKERTEHCGWQRHPMLKIIRLTVLPFHSYTKKTSQTK